MDGEDSEFGDFSSAFPSHGEKLTTNGQENIAPDSEFRASTENENCNLELNLDFSFNPVTPFATEGEVFEHASTVAKSMFIYSNC